MKLVHWTFAFCLFTASCDVILNFNIAGYVRLCQFLMIFVCLAGMAWCIQNGRVLWPRGATALSLWLFSQILFMPFCGIWSIGLRFLGLLLFTCAGVLAVVQLYGQSDRIEQLMRVYLGSYFFVAAYGLVQFLAPIIGLTAPFTKQWIVHGRLARINGFNYEPSYFATYMAIGWIMIVDLRLSGAKMTQGKFWKWGAIAITCALLFSTSKTGWVVMILEAVCRFAPLAWKLLRRILRTGKVPLPMLSARVLLSTASVIVVAIVTTLYLQKLNVEYITFLAGSGLAGTATHSTIDRMQSLRWTWSAILASPFIGHTLGGNAIYIAARQGITITSMDLQYGLHVGFPIILDILLASGIVGFIPFLLFLYRNTFGGMRMAAAYWPQERAKWLRAMSRAMIFEWVMLLADPNILRVYLWFHFTMITVVAYHLEFAPVPVIETAVADGPHFPSFEVPAAL